MDLNLNLNEMMGSRAAVRVFVRIVFSVPGLVQDALSWFASLTPARTADGIHLTCWTCNGSEKSLQRAVPSGSLCVFFCFCIFILLFASFSLMAPVRSLRFRDPSLARRGFVLASLSFRSRSRGHLSGSHTLGRKQITLSSTVVRGDGLLH